jgi:hypothetical protein
MKLPKHDHKVRHHRHFPSTTNRDLDIEDLTANRPLPSEKHRFKRQKRQTDLRLTNDTTFTLGKSPYTFDYDLVIPAGITVTIEAGVEMRFKPAAGVTVQG